MSNNQSPQHISKVSISYQSDTKPVYSNGQKLMHNKS